MSELEEAVKAAIREHIKCDATGMSPAVASVYLSGFDEATRAALAVVRERMGEPTRKMTIDGYTALMDWDARTGEDKDINDIWNAMIAASPLGDRT